MSDRDGPDEGGGGVRTAAPAQDATSPVSGYDFGYGGWTYTVNLAPSPADVRVPLPLGDRGGDGWSPLGEELPAGSPRANSLKNRLRTRRAADRSARADPALSFGARPAPPPVRAPAGGDAFVAQSDPAAPHAEGQPRRAGDDGEAVRRRRDPPRLGRRLGEEDADGGAGLPAPDLPTGEARHERLHDRVPEASRRPVAEPQPGTPGDAGSRRAARVGGSGSVVIEERLFELVDWSSGGIAIRSEGQYYRVGDVLPLEVEIDLGDYAVNLDLDGEVVNRTSERTGWRFRNPSETQRQVLRGLTHAAAHGRPFAAPRPLPGRAHAESARVPATAPRARRRIGPLTAMMSLPFNAAVVGTVALGGILAIESRSQPAAPAAGSGVVSALRAAVAVDRIALSAGASGRVAVWAKQPGDPVALGEAVVSVIGDAEAAEPSVVVSPCDCILARILVRDARVSVGDELAALYPRGAEGYVQAVFLPDEAPAVGDAATVALAYASEQFGGTVVRVGRTPQPGRAIGLSDEQLNAPGTVYARIRTNPPVPAALAGGPALVTLRPDAATAEAAGDAPGAPAPAPAPAVGAPAADPSQTRS